jgi:hypothetical protein
MNSDWILSIHISQRSQYSDQATSIPTAILWLLEISRGIKWPQPDVNYSSPASAEVKNEWSSAYNPCRCRRDVDNATSPLTFLHIAQRICRVSSRETSDLMLFGRSSFWQPCETHRRIMLVKWHSPAHLRLWEKLTQFPSNMGVGGIHRRPTRFGREEQVLPLPGFEA